LAELAFKGTGECFQAVETRIESDVGKTSLWLEGHVVGSTPQPGELHKLAQALPGDRRKLPVEVVFGQRRNLAQLLQRQLGIQMLLDMITYLVPLVPRWQGGMELLCYVM